MGGNEFIYCKLVKNLLILHCPVHIVCKCLLSDIVNSNQGLIGPYWSIRAALGPVLETLLLLDRLLFLQEQDDILEAVMVPIFDPILSPRNMALIAKKV